MFRFKFEKILNLREKKEEKVRAEFAMLLNQLYAYENEKMDWENKKIEIYNEFMSSMKNNMLNTDLYHSTFNYRQFVDKRIIDLISLIKKQKQALERKRLELIEAKKEKKILEKLKEKHYRKYLEEELKKEQEEIDEIALNYYSRRM